MMDDSAVVVSTSDDILHIGRRSVGSDGMAWQHLPLSVSDHALTRDGLLVAVSNDNLARIYSLPQHAWIDVSLGIVNPTEVTIARDDNSAALVGGEGHLVWLDLAQARRELHNRSSNPGHD
jgi:hypothetical protein